MLIYFVGFCISEVVNLWVWDIKKSCKCIFICDGKGSKDWYIVFVNNVMFVLD